ncbi:MAG: hypothetical protein KIT84_44010 [Labilithrix sp.]|nr:hypothetical protein [Labilithrix sp.]MCW5818044.1 hypothetical protein [Labilithrix sp.]
MRRHRASFLFFTAALVLVPAMAVTACSDDDVTVGPSTLLDGSTDGRTNAEGSVITPPPTNDANVVETSTGDSGGDDAGADADAATEADADADTNEPDASDDASANADADADADTNEPDADAATTQTTLDDATYRITVWTCTPAGGGAATDIKAAIAGDPYDIAEVELEVAGTAGRTDVLYSDVPGCTRSTTSVVSYPTATAVRFVGATSFTCSATCEAARCTAGNQASLTDTFSFTKTETSFSGTRTLDAAAVTGTLQGAVGCQAGDVEDVTYVKN